MEENNDKIRSNWEDIGLDNDFLFGKVMQDPDLCKEMLQRTLPDLAIERIEYVEPQKSIDPDADAKGIRLDIYVRGADGAAYVVEMQAVNTKELPKRSRYYRSITDLQLLDKGIHYKKLSRIYIIFICLFDLYEKGRHIYTFQETCQEDKDILMGDGAVTIFLNANGAMNDVSDELKAFLDYVAGKEPMDDPYIAKLDKAVKKAKMNRKWRREYMTLYMRDLENIEIGKEEGRKEGRQEGRREGRQEGRQEEREDGVKILIETCQEFGEDERKTISRIHTKSAVSSEEAQRYVANYWKK